MKLSYPFADKMSIEIYPEFPESKENTSVHERLAGAVGRPSGATISEPVVDQVPWRERYSVLQCCSRKGERRKAKAKVKVERVETEEEMPNVKA
jgi:hypothetical protein